MKILCLFIQLIYQVRLIISLIQNLFFFSSENNLTDEIFDQLEKLTLNHLKSLNLSKNKFTSNGIRKFFEEKIPGKNYF